MYNGRYLKFAVEYHFSMHYYSCEKLSPVVYYPCSQRVRAEVKLDSIDHYFDEIRKRDEKEKKYVSR